MGRTRSRTRKVKVEAAFKDRIGPSAAATPAAIAAEPSSQIPYGYHDT